MDKEALNEFELTSIFPSSEDVFYRCNEFFRLIRGCVVVTRHKIFPVAFKGEDRSGTICTEGIDQRQFIGFRD
jgi:hypothetical protein